jgi:hypothetical protein
MGIAALDPSYDPYDPTRLERAISQRLARPGRARQGRQFLLATDQFQSPDAISPRTYVFLVLSGLAFTAPLAKVIVS